MMAKTKEVLVVGSKVKAAVAEHGMRSDGALVEAISDKVHAMIKRAADRAKTNGRSTVRPGDL